MDSIVLIDTGIADITLEAAKSVARDKLITRKIKWPGSFADARNEALQMAADLDGVWGVFLDTDKRFAGDTGTIKGFLQSSTADSFVPLLEGSRDQNGLSYTGVNGLHPHDASGTLVSTLLGLFVRIVHISLWVRVHVRRRGRGGEPGGEGRDGVQVVMFRGPVDAFGAVPRGVPPLVVFSCLRSCDSARTVTSHCSLITNSCGATPSVPLSV